MIIKNFTLLNVLVYNIISLIVSTFARKRLTYKGLKILLTFSNLVLVLFCLFNWTFFIIKYGHEIINFKINSNNWTNISYEFSAKIDSLSFLFILLVSLIGFATNIYSLNYFKYEERSEEFILLINWFIFSMIVLVIGNNFFTLLIGWELIGLTSFLLINFWKFKLTTLDCSFKAFVFNKISDIFLIISFCLLWNTYKINNIDSLLTFISFNQYNYNYNLYYSCIFLIISSGIKSAQLIGHLWLPDSMEAPIPASALIHSATLVSAGIFLILRFQTLFLYMDLYSVIFTLGSITACYGGIVAAAQSDMKKLLAYSTISHCGFIFASIALNNFVVTIVYLYLHGIFKALTFFCAGSIIKYNNTQDMRLMGIGKSQVTNVIFLIIASTNLGGLPFTFGYLYKFLFLNFVIINPFNLLSFGFIIIGMLCSIIYIFKLIYYSCFDINKGHLNVMPLLLQNEDNFTQKYSLFFSFTKVIASYILYVFSILFYFIVQNYIMKIYIFFLYTPETFVNNYKFLYNLIFVNSHLIKIYYILFIFVIYILVIWNWRTNYFYIEKKKMIITVISFLTFRNLLDNFLNKIQNYIIHIPDLYYSWDSTNFLLAITNYLNSISFF